MIRFVIAAIVVGLSLSTILGLLSPELTQLAIRVSPPKQLMVAFGDAWSRLITRPGPTPTPFLRRSIVPTPLPSITPQTLVIPKLKISAPVESVGKTEAGNMEVPSNAANVGWYRYGAVPTLRGNAVLSGHYDTPSGRPAIFYRLKQLKQGDSIRLAMSDGNTYPFVVTGIENIPIDVFPTEYVFRDKFGINLNLITCSGIWDPEGKNYSKRLVVFATLKGTQFSTF